jgi:hypothetical protein
MVRNMRVGSGMSGQSVSHETNCGKKKMSEENHKTSVIFCGSFLVLTKQEAGYCTFLYKQLKIIPYLLK